MSESNARTNGHARDRYEATIARLAERAHEAVDSVARSAAQLERNMRERASQAAEVAQHSEQRAAEQINESARRTRVYLKRNPLVSVGVGFIAGAVLTSLLKK